MYLRVVAMFISAFSTKASKKWRNLHIYHVIIFYLLYVDHLNENIFRTLSFLTFRTIEKLFFALSYFRFYGMKFFHCNLMLWDAIIPKYFVFFRVTHFSVWQVPDKLPDWKFLRVTRKKYWIFGNKGFSRHQFPVE